MAITRIGNIASTIPDDSIQNAKLSNIVNFKNIIINGDMSIAQRGTSATGLTGGAYNTVDRWRTGMSTGGTWTLSQDTDVPTGQGFATSLKWDCTTANGSLSAGSLLFFQQKFEGQNLQYLKKGTSSAESLTASFWVKSNKTGTYICQFRDMDNGRSISQSYTISSANTWEKKIITIPGDTTGAFNNDNGESFRLQFWLAAGSTYSSGTLQTTWGAEVTADRAVGQVNLADSTDNEWYITGVQLEAGTTASDFEFLPVDVNLQRCFRYYQKSYSYGTALGTNTLVGIKTSGGGAGSLTTGYIYGDIQLHGSMRASPTVTLYDKAGNSGVCARLNGGVARTDNQNATAYDYGEHSFSISSTGTANAGSMECHFEASSEL